MEIGLDFSRMSGGGRNDAFRSFSNITSGFGVRHGRRLRRGYLCGVQDCPTDVLKILMFWPAGHSSLSGSRQSFGCAARLFAKNRFAITWATAHCASEDLALCGFVHPRSKSFCIVADGSICPARRALPHNNQRENNGKT